MTRLTDYIINGSIPSDIDYYAEHELERCPLCNKKHYNHIQIGFTLQGDGWTTPTTVYTYVCKDCYTAIEEADVLDYGIPDEPDAIKKYKKTGEFPEKANAFIALPHFCVFCRGDIGDVYMQLELPVGETSVGGIVSACEKCADLFYWTPVEQITEICKICGEEYPITKEEHLTRYSQNTEHQHCCTNCTIKEHGAFTVNSRFIPTVCSVCGSSIIADKTLHKKEGIKDARCREHANHIHVIQTGNKYTLNILYDRKFPNYRVVITDKISSIIVSLQVEDPKTEFYYVELSKKYILPDSVRHADIAILALNDLEKIIQENEYKWKDS